VQAIVVPVRGLMGGVEEVVVSKHWDKSGYFYYCCCAVRTPEAEGVLWPIAPLNQLPIRFAMPISSMIIVIKIRAR
jgi:hypothetical protein